MENKNQSAFGYGYCTANGESHSESTGLSKREYTAIKIFASIRSDYNTCEMLTKIAGDTDKKLNEVIATIAVKDADELLKQLES